MGIYNFVSFIGIFLLAAVAWLLSANRRRFNFRCVCWGITLQLIFGAFVFLVPAGAKFFLALSDAVVKLINAARAGTQFCFGPLAIPPGQAGSPGFILLFQGLATIVFFATLMEILYFLKIMPFLIRQFSRLFTRLMGVSGAESLCTASNIFLGIESMTTVRPYLERMTRSELCTVLTAGMATVASSMLGVYVMMLQSHFPNIAGHLISASILSAPAALVMAKLLLPETETPETLGRLIPLHIEHRDTLMEAAMRGAMAGGQMVLGIVVMLLAFLGLVELLNLTLAGAAHWAHLPGAWRLENILAYVFYPFTLIIGVPPDDALTVARLLGMRAIMTEIPAYQQLNDLLASGALHHGRSAVLASYALCGFAHIASMAIFVGGTAALAPRQTQTLARVAFRALAAATLACLMTAAIAGTFYGHGTLLLNVR